MTSIDYVLIIMSYMYLFRYLQSNFIEKLPGDVFADLTSLRRLYVPLLLIVLLLCSSVCAITIEVVSSL